MSKPSKIFLGLATIWPVIYMFIFMAFIFSQIFIAQISGGEPALEIFFFIFILHFLTIIEIFVLLIIYVRDVFKNPAIIQEKKTLWAVVLFLGNMIAMPVYWYLYIWQEPAKNPNSS
ncbi:MAG: hypothetical protein M1355_01315 [Patescibacteria group bacterium]|nr:hypothetical protein [Patescibacteria group bacterium]